MIAIAPRVKIAAPDSLLIHQSCLSLNLVLNAFTNEVRIYHQRAAPKNTPLVVINECVQLVLSLTTPNDAKSAMNRKIANGFVIVTAKTEK